MEIKRSKLANQFTPTIFGSLKKAANERANVSTKIIDLSLGSPDLPPAKIVRETLATYSKQEKMYGYTLGGIQRFNEAVVNYYKRRSNITLNPKTEVLQTMGSQEGLVHFPLAFCNECDIVLTTNPAYIAYETGIKLAGASPYYLPLREDNNFLPDLSAIPTEIAKKAKLLILNLPGNPVPAMPTETFFSEVVRFAKKYNIIVLHDAAYSEYYFKGERPISFLATPGARAVGVEINSLSKSFSLAGARIAYFVGNERVIQIMSEFKSNLDYGTFAPIQEAAITALNHAEEITDRLRVVFRERHQILSQGLAKLGWDVAPSDGGMFIWARYPFTLDDVTFAYRLIEKIGIIMIPGTIFGTGGKGFMRIALVQKKELLEEALHRLQSFSIK